MSARQPWRDLPPRPGHEVEADSVSAHSDSDEGVFFVCDATDLYEHVTADKSVNLWTVIRETADWVRQLA